MFLDFYGLREQPFGVTPDPAYLYLSRTHREALAALLYGIKADRGFMALVAEPGMGKTTLLYRLMEELGDSARTVFLFQTQWDSRDFFRYLLSEMGIDPTGMDPVLMHKKLNKVLFSEMLAARRFVIIVDEAQNLEGSVLETMRLLSNFETPHAKLLEIILSGQPQLAETLAQRGLSQLRQRIAIFSRLEPLSADETACYIERRLKVAGYSGGVLFTPDAVALITKQCQGIPREINNICFNLLKWGAARGYGTITGEIVRKLNGFQTTRGEEVLASANTSSTLLQSPVDGHSATVAAFRTSSLKLCPGDPFFECAEEINKLIACRAYELFESQGCVHGRDRENWLCAESEILLPLAVDVSETETDLAIRADVPGFREKDLEVRVAPRSLCITGKRPEGSDREEGKTVYSERRSKRIFRVLELPCEIDPDTVQATVSDGLLALKLSKVGLGNKVPILARAAIA